MKAYCDAAAAKSDLDRTELAKEKTGVFTGAYAINPVNGEPMPIWIADYVLISYGTGAIMAVPAHDERDFEFAQQFDLPIMRGRRSGRRGHAKTSATKCWPASGVLPATGWRSTPARTDGLTTAEFKQKIAEDLNVAGLGRAAVNYKLRDWLFCRQRFWGEPFPILHELDADRQAHRPRPRGRPSRICRSTCRTWTISNRHGRPEPPLDKAPDDWLYPAIDGVRYKRETNTMPQWAGSCWYYLRFLDPKNEQALVDPEVEKAWMPVDLYVGGAEHAVLHLLYARSGTRCCSTAALSARRSRSRSSSTRA